MLSLKDGSPKFWTSIYSVRKKLINSYKHKSKILEIGPGDCPLEIATEFIISPNEQSNSNLSKKVNIDIDVDSFPYENSNFDFIYSRHVLEDIQNPDFVFKEMVRVSGAGYIETPSPLVECTRYVDGSTKYAGYIHHRYIVWTEKDTNTLCFIPKYPLIEYIIFEPTILSYLEKDIYWNNYYEWNIDNPPNIKMYKNEINFKMSKDYINLIDNAIIQSIKHTEWFTRDVYP